MGNRTPVMGHRTRRPGPVGLRAPAGAGVLAPAACALAVLLTLLLIHPGVSPGRTRPTSARTRPSAALYYETRTDAGLLAISRVSLMGRRISEQVVVLPNVGVFGIAVAGGYVYWATQAGPRDRGAIMRATLTGADVRQVVGGLPAPNSIVAVGGHVYWSDQHAIGRVALDGSHLQRRFLVLPQERGGGVADGLAAESGRLYFSRCPDDAIGRVGLSRRRVTQRFIATGPGSCPQGLAVAGGRIYWTQLGSGTIGRARLAGGRVDGRWLDIHSSQGPFQIAADGAHIYWTWGGVDGSPAYTGRANADRSHLDRRFLADSIYPVALAGGG